MRRRNPSFPTGLVVGAVAGAGLLWWFTRGTSTPAPAAPVNRYLTGEESNAIIARAEAAAGRRLSREESAALLQATGRAAPLMENLEGVFVPVLTPEQQRAAELHDAQRRAGVEPVGPGASAILAALTTNPPTRAQLPYDPQVNYPATRGEASGVTP